MAGWETFFTHWLSQTPQNKGRLCQIQLLLSNLASICGSLVSVSLESTLFSNRILTITILFSQENDFREHQSSSALLPGRLATPAAS